MDRNGPIIICFLLGTLFFPMVTCEDNAAGLHDVIALTTDTDLTAPTVLAELTTPTVSEVPSVVPLSTSTAAVPKNPTMTKHPLNPTTPTDVCGLSLVAPNEESDVKHQKCKCSNRDEDVDCSYLDVSELPKQLSFPNGTRIVSFGGNKIENIADDTFYNGRNVFELDLSHNRIDFISSVAFKAFRNLRDLDLSHNKIWNMPSKSFQGLKELRYLDLGYNDIVSLSSDLFSEASGLKTLILESNPLQELEPRVFEHLSKLEVLSLESTLLKVVPDHIFLFTPKLKMLDLSNNQLTEVPSDALRILDHLKGLELSSNPISSIKAQAFLGMRGLVMLYLERMPLLTKIEKYAFGDLQQLQELHCSYNFLLTELDEHAFVKKVDNKKVQLSQLFLKQNSLEMISKDLLSWSEDVELHIEDNPLSCDCHAEWMVNLRLKNNFQNHATCSSPSYLADMSLSQLKDHTLSCGMELSEMVMIAIAIVVSIIIIVLIVAFLVWRRSFSGYRRPYFKVKRKNVEDVDYRGDECI